MQKWSRTDGIGAIIISPTRELAYQIFETLKKVGKHHDFSAGLIIGGKNLKFERTRMDQCNILICTPGRLLQHMDENPLFNATTMELLVLDEADRCLDMGFEKTLNAIIENFPPDRQTLLFSATQTNSVKDLARLNLRNPVYVGNRNAAAKAESEGKVVMKPVVPDLLQQSYVVIPLEEKITMLWSFLKNHLKQKIIVFLASCKQVKYVYEIFCKLRPGTSLLALYGTLHQDRRIAIYNDFVKKSNVIMFATDVASRGLDFPAVNWVVQLDCPEDVTQYIHRAGRSARNKTRGESLLVLMPSEEEAMIKELQEQNINIRKIHIDPKKLFSPRVKMEAFLAQNPELKASAQRAFLAYLKSVFLMKNKSIFNVFSLNYDEYAKSLGLAITPRVRFLERFTHKNNNNATPNTTIKHEDDEEQANILQKFEQNKLKFNNSDSESDSEDDLIKIKRKDHEIAEEFVNNNEEEEAPLLPIPKREKKLITKASLAKKALKKKLQVNEKVKFDEEGNEIVDERKQLQSELAKKYEEKLLNEGGIDLNIAKQLLSEEDKYDKQRFRELVKQRHKQQKLKLKEKLAKDDEASSDEDDEAGDSDDNSVDLSWLPDPDKVYKNKTDSENESDNEHDIKLGKRKAQNGVNKQHSESEDSSSSDEEQIHTSEPFAKKMKVTSKLTLNDAELIAQQLLAKSM